MPTIEDTVVVASANERTTVADDLVEKLLSCALNLDCEASGAGDPCREAIKRLQAALTPEDFQLLHQLERDNVAGAARPVIESQGWEQARRLSEEGLLAIESVSLGGRLHITRKGVKAVAAFKQGFKPL